MTEKIISIANRNIEDLYPIVGTNQLEGNNIILYLSNSDLHKYPHTIVTFKVMSINLI